MILSIWHGLDLVLLFVRKLSLTRQSLSDIKMQSLLQLRSFSNTSKLSNCATLAVVIYVCFGILYISASPSELIKKHSQLANNNETRNEQKIRDKKSSAIQTYFDLWKNDSNPTKNSHLLKWEVTWQGPSIRTTYASMLHCCNGIWKMWPAPQYSKMMQLNAWVKKNIFFNFVLQPLIRPCRIG